MDKNRNGFTLMELLVVVAIIGVILTIAISSTSNYIGRGKVTYYQNLEKNIRVALQDYTVDYRSLLPREIGEIATVTQDELTNNKYIEGVVDEKKEPCEFNLAVEKNR